MPYTFEDLISNGGGGANAGTQVKGTKGWSDANSGDAVVQQNGGGGANTGTQLTNGTTRVNMTSAATPGGYVDILNKFGLYKPPTEEQLKKENKKKRRERVIAALGDGIAALSNLYFTSQGAPNMYTGNNTLSGAVNARWQKLKDDREKNKKLYFDAYMRAKQLDDEAAHRDRVFNYGKDRDQKADEKWSAQQQFEKERMAIANQQWREQFDYTKNRHQQEFERQNGLDAFNQQMARANFAQRQAEQKDLVDYRNRTLSTKHSEAVKKKMGKPVQFHVDDKNFINIYDGVWKANWPKVYAAMVAEMNKMEKVDGRNPRALLGELNTPQKQKAFVEGNWMRFKSSADLMNMLANDPIGNIDFDDAGDDEIADYSPQQPSDDEVVDYVPNN